MTRESSRSFVEASLKRAEKALKSAELLEENGELEDAASRAYYAMFHATRALLFKSPLRTKSNACFPSYFFKRSLIWAVLSRCIILTQSYQ